MFGADLDELLVDSSDEIPDNSDQPSSDHEPDWDTVNIVPDIKEATKSNTANAKSSTAGNVVGNTQAISTLIPRPLPKLNSLSRPEVLFPTLLPALIMVHGGSTEIYVEGTHPPTLELIADYFTNHARKDLQGGGFVSYSSLGL